MAKLMTQRQVKHMYISWFRSKFFSNVLNERGVIIERELYVSLVLIF